MRPNFPLARLRSIKMRRLFGIEGLACAGCARGLEGRLKGLPQIHSAVVHYLSSSALIDWDETALPAAELQAMVAKAGYRLVPRQRPEDVVAALSKESATIALRLVIALFAGMWSMAPAMVLYFGDLGEEVSWWLALASGIFALPVVFWAGRGFLWMGWRSVRLRAPGMDLLISLGALASMGLSAWNLARGRSDVWFDTATMLVTLLLLGRLLDLNARRSAAEALHAMEAASPEIAMVERDGLRTPQPIADLPIGTTFIVDAGAPVPLDGVVTVGESMINRAVLTGESRLVAVAPGDRVEAGAFNSAKRLVMSSDRAYGAREIDLMGGAVALELARRGTVQTRADLWAGRLAVMIPLAALGVMALSLVFGLAVSDALLRGLTVLVAACPCALSIALPLAGMRSAHLAAGLGLRLRDPEAFLQLGRLRSLVFDKTGTLTDGRPAVAEVRPAPDGPSPEELLRLAARTETGIDHPIAQAILAAHGRDEGPGGERRERSAVFASEGIEIGAARVPLDSRHSWLDLCQNGELLGQIGLSDVARPEAEATVEAMKREGLTLAIASGDSIAATRSLGHSLGLDPAQLHGALTPLQKVAVLEALPRPCGFVGDGVNDGPALTAADCGVSVASAHSAAAHTADVVILQGGLERLLPAITLSRRHARIAAQNLVLGAGYNLAILPFAALGLIGPAAAAAAMFASSLSVVLNTLRLGRPEAQTSPSLSFT